MIVKLKSLIFSIILLLCFFGHGERVYAGSYSYYLGSYYAYYGYTSYSVSGINITGHNLTHGTYQQIIGDITSSYSSGSGGWYFYYLNYTLPDDGCTWRVQGFVDFASYTTPPEQMTNISYFYKKVDETRTTTGSFSGYSPKTATDAANTASINAQNASTAATQARDAANIASTNAQNAVNDTNYIRNSMLSTSGGIVQDASGTVLNEARLAKTNASAAKTSADAAKASADSAATLAMEARNNIPVIISKVQGINQATCTTGTSFTAVVSISPSNNISYSVSCAGPVTPTISVSGNNITFNNLTAAGAYTATITATNTVTGGTAQTTFTFFRV